jgi:hypothetical protein
MKNRVMGIMGLLVLVGACAQPLQISESCSNGFYTTTQGEIMQWPDGHRVDFEMHEGVPVEMRPAISTATGMYNDLFSRTTLNLDESPSRKTPTFRGEVEGVSGDGINAIYWVADKNWAWAKSDPNAVAMTVVSFSVDGIQEADIFFKASSYMPASSTVSALRDGVSALLRSPATAFAPLSANFQEQKAYLIGVHEFGHAMGRCHSESADSIMYSTVNPSSAEQLSDPFSKGDVKTFKKAYSVSE